MPNPLGQTLELDPLVPSSWNAADFTSLPKPYSSFKILLKYLLRDTVFNTSPQGPSGSPLCSLQALLISLWTVRNDLCDCFTTATVMQPQSERRALSVCVWEGEGTEETGWLRHTLDSGFYNVLGPCGLRRARTSLWITGLCR